MLWASASWSGESYIFDQNDYDQSTGLLVIPITGEIEKDGLISSYEQQITKNMFIYDPRIKKGRKLFDKYYGQITNHIMESALSKDGHIVYLGSSSVSTKNNEDIKSRPIRSSMLIETFSNSTKQYTLWKAEKMSGTPTVLFTYAKPSSWHIDTKAGIIRLIVQAHENITVSDFAW
jgi:hypothetical protein